MKGDYCNGKIYRLIPTIEGVDESDVYYGSTILSLARRFALHKSDFKTKNKFTTAVLLFNKYGVSNVVIELVEEYPCNNRTELELKEGEYIKNNLCINRCVAGRKTKDWVIDNLERHLTYQKQWRDSHKEYRANYYQTNKESLQAKFKIYNLKRKQERNDLKNNISVE